MWWRKAVVIVPAAVLGGLVRVATVRGEASAAAPHAGDLRVVAPAAPLFDAWRSPAPPPAPAPSWLRLGGQKIRAPKLNRAEAGLTVDLGHRVAFQLHYARTAMAPTMHRDHDDGILTRLRVSF